MLELQTTRKRKVGIIGNLNIDLIIRNVPHLPEWSHEVLGENYSVVSSGQATNTAFALRKLGQYVKIIGNVGEDNYGKQIIDELKKNGINISEVEITKSKRTGITVAIVRSDGERGFVSDPSCLRQFTYELVNRHVNSLNDCDLVCLVGIFFLPGITLPEIYKILINMKSHNKPILLDTGWDSGNWQPKTIQQLIKLLGCIDIFIPNMDEAKAITGHKDPQRAAESLFKAGPKIVIVKMGSEGSFLYTFDTQLHIPALKVKVVDAVGAGDVFNAGFIHGYLQNWPLPACVQFGNSVSSLYISRTENRFPDITDTIESANKYDEYKFIL
jgi:sugar/nucleoside kinase (ribokinase family)